METTFYVGLVLFFLFGPWILVWRMHRGRELDREEDQSRWRQLTSRVLALELALKELRDRIASSARSEPARRESAVEEPAVALGVPAKPVTGEPTPLPVVAKASIGGKPVEAPVIPPPSIFATAPAPTRPPSFAKPLLNQVGGKLSPSLAQ